MGAAMAIAKSKQLGILTVQIVREEYEMILLSRIFESPFGKKLVFRGGTALRLAYASPRFSDDLDFTQLQPISVGEFRAWCQGVADRNESFELVEASKKRVTLFALFKVKDPVLQATISIKVEISVREKKWIQEKDYTLIPLISEITPVTALAQVATLTRIKEEKLAITPPRIRDVFDLWFIGQRLGRPSPMDFGSFPSKEVKRELYRLLPESTRRLIAPWV